MTCSADGLLALAREQIGVREDTNGVVKYNVAYYGRSVKGSTHPWCCVFVWWLFRTLFSPDLYYGGEKTAYCPALMRYHQRIGQGVAPGDYQPGDVVFFNFAGVSTAAHVGICEKWDGSYITTIDGNTGRINQTAGGQVLRRRRAIKYIVGAYRPAYREEDDDMTQEQFDAMLENWLYRQAQLPPSSWSKMAEAKAMGITDGTRPQSFATREEVATMLVNALEK